MNENEDNENVGYTVHYSGNKIAEESLYSTFGRQGVPVFKTEEEAIDFGNLTAELMTLLLNLADKPGEIEVKAIPVWMA